MRTSGKQCFVQVMRTNGKHRRVQVARHSTGGGGVVEPNGCVSPSRRVQQVARQSQSRPGSVELKVSLIKIKETIETNQEECNKVVEAADLKYDELSEEFKEVGRRNINNAGQGAINTFEKELDVLT